MQYEDYKRSATLRSGDLVIFNGSGAISTAIKRFTLSKWSHVGIVFVLDCSVFVLESTSLGDNNGVQLNLLSERIRQYPNGVGIRQIVATCDTTQRNMTALKNVHTTLSLFRREMKGRPYEKDMLELVKAAYDGPFGKNIEDLSSLFCSELVAEALQRCDVITQRLPSNEWTPKDFSQYFETVFPYEYRDVVEVTNE